jgi:hypothetical protein
MSVDERFWAKVDKDGPTLIPELGPCWEWTAALNAQGYGIFGTEHSHTKLAHRYSLALHLGRPLVANALHRCDNPKCVRPSHLWEGTRAENSRDMARKGRSTHGEKNPAHKLTPMELVAIRADLASGVTQLAIGKKFGVHQTTISDIKRRESWTRV